MSNFVQQIVKKTSNRIGFPLGQLCALISGPKLPPRAPALATVCTPTAPNGDTSWGLTGEDGFLSPILWAVPKKRVSRHKKRLRMQSKWLRPIQNYTPCPKCGNPKLLHVLCGTCLRRTMRKTAEYRKKNAGTLYSRFKNGIGF